MNPFVRISAVILAGLLFTTASGMAQRQMEKLGRGVIALKKSSTTVYVGWRMLGNDPEDIAFNLYRSANGAAAVKVNSSPLTVTTDYTDTPANLTTTAYSYYVKPVINGVEQAASGAFTLAANAPIRQYLSIPLQSIPPYPGDATDTAPYDVKFCWVGDLDGDGEYEFVVDRLSSDASTGTSAGHREYVEAYKRDGTFLWRVNMGPNSTNQYNIEPGASAISVGHSDHVTVFDMDGDGKAEVLLKTANGTILGNGVTVTAANNTIEYISVLDGMTGAEKPNGRATIPNPYFSDGPLAGHFGILYSDGIKPTLIFQGKNRDSNNDFHGLVTTWDYRNGQISQRWSWIEGNIHAPEGHQIRIADPDNDGKDEYCDIGYALDDDGTKQLYNIPEVVHGDRYHISDIDPDRPGLEEYIIQQNNASGLATAYFDPGAGKIIKKWYASGIVDVGRGDAADIDPGHKGCELFSTQPGIFDAKGNLLYSSNPFPPETIWWDGDLSREFLATVGSGATSPAIAKFNVADPSSQGARLYSIYQEGVHQAYGGRPEFWGDILGDWREEIVLVANDFSELRIYCTTIPSTTRLYTLMHNPQYRCQTTVKGYVQSSFVDYYLGTGMTPTPPPPMVDAKLVWRGGTGSTTWDNGTTASWLNSGVNSAFTAGDTVRFDISGNNSTAVNLTGSLQPGGVTVYNPKDYTFSGTGSLTGAMKLTKVGAGALILPGTHTFTGKTVVWDGALLVNGDLQQSPVTVWGGIWGGQGAAGLTGGRVGGTGRFSQPVTVKYRGTVTPGAGMNSVGTVTFGSGLTLEDGSSLALDLSDDPTGATKPSDRVAVTGNLALSGTVNIILKAINGQIATGTYTLLTYTGTLTGSLSNLAVQLPVGTPYTLAASNGVITVTVPTTRAPAGVVWSGGVSGNKWDLAASQNWKRSGASDVFVSNDTVTLDATGAANPTITLTTALPTTGVTVNSSTNYTLNDGGNGSISGTGGLTKSGTGTLTINTTNDYTGPTLVNGGVLAVSNLNDGGAASSIGAADTPASNLVINGGTLRLTGGQTNTNRSARIDSVGGTLDIPTSGNSLQISGGISGAGTLTKSGAGTLIVANANTYTGNTVINGGKIQLSSSAANSNGLGTGTVAAPLSVTINNGTVAMSDVQANETAAWNIVVPAGATARVEADGRCTMTGSLTGSGIFTFMTPYVRTDLKGDWSQFSGQINVVSDDDGGDFRVTNTAGFSKAALNLGDQVYAYYNANPSAGLTLDIGELSGVAGSSLKGGTGGTLIWRVGAKNTDSTYAGVIANNTGLTALTKTGTGTLTLTGACTYTGATAIQGGMLLVNGSLAGSAITVQNGGALGGSGQITGNVTISSGGTLAVGAGSVLTITGNLTNNGTVRYTGGAAASVSGSFINNGVLDLITGPQALPANFVNNGIVLDSSVARALSVTRAGSNVSLTIQSYAGHSYQLQKRTSLTSGTWTSVGAAQAGTTGVILTLSDTGGATGTSNFYRILVSP